MTDDIDNNANAEFNAKADKFVGALSVATAGPIVPKELVAGEELKATCTEIVRLRSAEQLTEDETALRELINAAANVITGNNQLITDKLFVQVGKIATGEAEREAKPLCRAPVEEEP